MQTIYHVDCELFGEQDFFFDDHGKLLHVWDRNDADFRSEYMKPLFKKLGIEVKEAKVRDEKFWPYIKEYLEDNGATEADLNYGS